MNETNLMKKIQMRASELGVRLFRNNTGKTWIGKSTMFQSRQMVEVNRGDVVIRQARRFHAGLYKGSSDLIGWKSIVITDEMVGQSLAVFVSAEVKTPKGRVSMDQAHWIKTVNRLGGIAGVVRSEEDIEELLKN